MPGNAGPSREMRVVGGLGALGLCVLLNACANWNTVDRTTPLESRQMLPTDKQGVAIHLDAQQRLLIYNKDGKYCSEPSPDAMAAYAAGLALSASVPGTGAGSASQNAASTAAAI